MIRVSIRPLTILRTVHCSPDYTRLRIPVRLQLTVLHRAVYSLGVELNKTPHDSPPFRYGINPLISKT